MNVLRTVVRMSVLGVCALTLMGCPSGNVGGIDSATTCLACHNGRSAEDMRLFLIGSHRNITCGTCHVGSDAHVQSGGVGGALVNPSNWPIADEVAVCQQCHHQEAKDFKKSVHAQSGLVACDVCHDVHTPIKTRGPFVNNVLCQSCHLANWPSHDAISLHTNHPVDPSGTGASRCVGCHMPAQTRPDSADQEEGPHSHSFITVPPSVTADQVANGDVVLPNSCAGTTGCHDGTVPAAPIFNIDSEAQMNGLQSIYDSWFNAKDGAKSEQ